MSMYFDPANAAAALNATYGQSSVGLGPFSCNPFGQQAYMSYLSTLSERHPSPIVRQWARGRLENVALAEGGAVVRFDRSTGRVNARGSNQSIIEAERRMLSNPNLSMGARMAFTRDLIARGGTL